MAIDRRLFARECVEQALLVGVNPHFLTAVAELLSGINDDADDGRIGPFRIMQEHWNSNASAPEFGVALQREQINVWELQCSFAAIQTYRAQAKLLAKLSRYPSADELYSEWPAVVVPAGKSLAQALDATSALMVPAVDALLEGMDEGAATGQISLASIKPERRDIAKMIVQAFAAAGYGTLQQVAALANAIAESNLNPEAHNTSGEDSVGLFQLNRRAGVGSGHSVAELRDPAKNIALIIREANKVEGFRAARTLQDAVAIFVRRVERPADASGETVKRLGIAQKLLA